MCIPSCAHAEEAGTVDLAVAAGRGTFRVSSKSRVRDHAVSF